MGLLTIGFDACLEEVKVCLKEYPKLSSRPNHYKSLYEWWVRKRGNHNSIPQPPPPLLCAQGVRDAETYFFVNAEDPQARLNSSVMGEVAVVLGYRNPSDPYMDPYLPSDEPCMGEQIIAEMMGLV